MTEELLRKIGEKYELTECGAGEFALLKVKGMKFTIRAFEAKGLGHVSLMEAKGFFGLMKMDTLIVTPSVIDLPLYSYDRIIAMGNDTLIAEYYDTLESELSLQPLLEVKEKYADLPERDPGMHWYDSIRFEESVSKKGKKISGRMNDLARDGLTAYLSLPAEKTKDLAAKREKTKVYVEGLLKNGGPSTDVFKKELGEEKTGTLFRTVLFKI